MKHYQKGGDIPQEAKNKIRDAEQERERKKFMQSRRDENEAPKKSVKKAYDRVRDMFGIGDDDDKKAKGGKVKMAKGGYVRKADGCAQRGKTKGKMV